MYWHIGKIIAVFASLYEPLKKQKRSICHDVTMITARAYHLPVAIS